MDKSREKEMKENMSIYLIRVAISMICIIALQSGATTSGFFSVAASQSRQGRPQQWPEEMQRLKEESARLYSAGKYAEAIPIVERMLQITEKSFGSVHLETITVLNGLALFYERNGDYAKAESAHLRVLQIKEKTLGSDNPEIVRTLKDFAAMYERKGDYTKAEPLYERALRIREKALGPNHPNTATSLNDLARYYQWKGDFAEAERMYLRSLEVYEKKLGPEHKNTAIAIGSLGVLYFEKEEYAKAEQWNSRALELYKKLFGLRHPTTEAGINNLALAYEGQGNYSKAESLLLLSLDIAEEVYGPEDLDTATTLNNLATLYQLKKDYGKAEPLYVRALNITRKTLGPEHPITGTLLTNIAGFYYAKGDTSQAITFLSLALSVMETDIRRNISIGSERQITSGLNSQNFINLAISLHIRRALQLAASRDLALTAVIQFKGRGLDAITDSISVLRRRASPEDRAFFDRLAQARSSLAAITLSGPMDTDPMQHRINLKTLEDEVEKIEIELSRRSAEFRKQITPVTIDTLKEAVPSGSVLVEFSLFSSYNPSAKVEGRTYSDARYVAYVLTRGSEAQWVDLGEAKAIDKAVAEWRSALRNPSTGDTGRGPKVVTKGGDVKQLAREVDRLVMQPVRKLIGHINHVLVSPDGALNLVPFAALVHENNHYLVESLQITYLTTARDLMRLAVKSTGREDALLIGNPAFNDVGGPSPAGSTENRQSSDYGSRNYGPLPGAEEEVDLVQRTLPGARLLIGKQATEVAIKQVSGPRILHIATHGFFVEDQKPEPSGPDLQDLMDESPGHGKPDAAFRACTCRGERQEEREGGRIADSPGGSESRPLRHKACCAVGVRHGSRRSEDRRRCLRVAPRASASGLGDADDEPVVRKRPGYARLNDRVLQSNPGR